MSYAAPASAQSLEEACADAQVVPGSCIGITKITERAAAECRRAGIPDESCVLPMSRRVIRNEVRAHASSWLHRTLAFQYELGSSLSLRDATWLGTHNSFNSPGAETTLSSTDSNQQLSLTDQLKIDIRSLELDVHWLPSPHAGGQPAPVVCHGRGSNELHAGCTTERLLGPTLDEVASWLNANDDQVLLLYLEDNVDAAEGYGPTAAVIDSELRDEKGRSLVYRPSSSGGSCSDLPLSLTRDKVRAAGAQVVIVSGCGQGSAWRGLVFDWGDTHVEGGGEGYRDAPACDPRFDAQTYATKLVRFFEDSTWLSATVTGEGEGLTPEITRFMTRCGVDLFGFDQILPRDERLQAAVWSWAPDQPSSKDGDCTLQRGDGRWISRKCTKRHRAACVRPSGSWLVTATSVTANAAQAACRARSASHTTPRNGTQNEAIRQASRAAGADGVWIATVP